MNPSDAALSRRTVLGLLPFAGIARAQDSKLTDAAQEKFLKEAKVVRARGLSVGVTGSRRATLSDGTFTHDAHLQSIDESRVRFESNQSTEMNFRDTWKFNVAAYRLDRMLDLNMIPVSVERRYEGSTASFTWWVDEVLMMEGERFKKKISAPDLARWNCQMNAVHIFDQLIHNMDRNLQNLLITRNWDLWMIDHTRAFRLSKTARDPKVVRRCDRQLLSRLKQLNNTGLTERLKPYLTQSEIDGVLGRRDHILQILEQQIRTLGESQVIYERSQWRTTMNTVRKPGALSA